MDFQYLWEGCQAVGYGIACQPFPDLFADLCKHWLEGLCGARSVKFCPVWLLITQAGEKRWKSLSLANLP